MRNSLAVLCCCLSLALGACSKDRPGSLADASAPNPPALVSGTIELDEKLKALADPLAVIFIIARNEQGQIVAVKKLLPPFQYPLGYALTGADVMIQGTELSGKIKITARLDKDGNANPAQPGDILGKTTSEWVSAGSQEVRIFLNELIP